MSQTRFFAVSAAAPSTEQINPFEVMVSAKQLPTEHLTDYSVIFN